MTKQKGKECLEVKSDPCSRVCGAIVIDLVPLCLIFRLNGVILLDSSL